MSMQSRQMQDSASQQPEPAGNRPAPLPSQMPPYSTSPGPSPEPRQKLGKLGRRRGSAARCR